MKLFLLVASVGLAGLVAAQTAMLPLCAVSLILQPALLFSLHSYVLLHVSE